MVQFFQAMLRRRDDIDREGEEREKREKEKRREEQRGGSVSPSL